MSLRLLALAALSWGSLPTMCATTPEPEAAAPPAESPFTPGPDGLPIRPAPADEVQTGALPEAEPREEAVPSAAEEGQGIGAQP